VETTKPLSQQQIETFKTEGYLVVPGIIGTEYIDHWQQAIWQEIGGSVDDVASWQGKTTEPRAQFEPESWRLHNHPTVEAIVEQLGGGGFVCGHDSCVTTWPLVDATWQKSARGHLDGYNDSIGWWPFMLSATTYVHDVGPQGGALQLWPQSHIAAWRHFREHPDHIEGAYRDDPTWNEKLYGEGTPPSIEFTANAGDVVFWHAFMAHNGTMNCSNRPRIGLFTRWQHREQDAIKHEIPEDLWKYWGV